MLSTARDLLAPVVSTDPLAAPAALLGDDLDFSSRHKRGRIDDAHDDVVERLGHAHHRLGRRLDEKTSRARRKRRCLCRGHLSGVFLDGVHT